MGDEELAAKLRQFFNVETNLKASEMMIGLINHVQRCDAMLTVLMAAVSATVISAAEAAAEEVPPTKEMN